MPYTVTTEAARIAIARRELRDALAEIDRKLKARLLVLAAAHRVREDDPAALAKLGRDDDEVRNLVVERLCHEVICDVNIEQGCTPTIGEPGEPIRWSWPQDMLRKA
jgi:hypothetical protein